MQVVAGTNYFVKVNTLSCGGTKRNETGTVVLKIFQVYLIYLV